MKPQPCESSHFDQTTALPSLRMKKSHPKPFGLENRAETERGNEIWLLTLSDLLMLLMIFFVVLFGMALQREKKADSSPLRCPNRRASPRFPLQRLEILPLPSRRTSLPL